MEKRLQKDKREFRCLWGFHHFYRSSRNQKLLANGRIQHKNTSGKLQQRELDMLAKRNDSFYKTNDRAESKALTVFAGNKNVKNLTRRDKKRKKQIIASAEKRSGEEIGLFDHLIEKYKAERDQLPVHQSNVAEKRGFEQASSSDEVNECKISLADMLEDACNQIHPGNKDAERKIECADEIDIQLVQMSAKAFVDQLFIDRKCINRHRASSDFTGFSDAFEMLYSNKDQFLKFLRDPNSLLAKQVQNLQNEETEKEAIKSFLDRKFPDHQSCETIKTKRLSDPKPSNRIVVLKPVLGGVNVACNCSYSVSHQSLSNKSKSFSLADIKRKLKYAMREKWKQQQLVSTHATSHRLDCSRRALRVRDEENIAVVKTKTNKLKSSGNEPETGCTTETVCKKMNLSKQQEFDTFLEAKRHISKRFMSMNEDESVQICKPKTLARILDSPERDFSATQSPKGYSHKWMRFSPLIPENEEISSCFGSRRLDSELNAFSSSSSEHQHDAKCVTETYQVKHPSSTQTSEPLTETYSSFFSQCSGSDSPPKSPQPGSSLDVSSSSPLSISKLDVSEDVKDKKEHPSPVSVLNLSFTEDVDSPTSLTEQPRETLLQPRCINFEEYTQQNPPLNPDDDKDTISSIVDSALQSFYMNWEEFWVNSHSPEQLLQELICDELELSTLDTHCNLELLLDYINEVLLEMYQCHFKCPQPKFQSLPPEKDLIFDKVITAVNDNLYPVKEQPTLDRLIAKDLAKPGSWIDIGINSVDIVKQLAEDILEESIMEIILF